MTLKKNATQADVEQFKQKKGPVVELGSDKAERSGAESLHKYPDEVEAPKPAPTPAPEQKPAPAPTDGKTGQ